MDPKAEQFRFYVFTRAKLGADRMKTHADLTDEYGANCISYRTVCRWIEGFTAGKVSLGDAHCPGRPVSIKNEQTAFCEETY